MGFAHEKNIKITTQFRLSDNSFAGKAHATDWVYSEPVGLNKRSSENGGGEFVSPKLKSQSFQTTLF
ncbi:hypothetical protein HMPREF2568_07800 [Neisseria sp. HMSC059F02]|nr:hypothetical protein HMPREF2638_11020 [Neisseria sp. HMSC055F11]OFN31801.1 hypothetical protein HMPREF2568_07800 [Neisseria sp. HMSC059F02]